MKKKEKKHHTQFFTSALKNLHDTICTYTLRDSHTTTFFQKTLSSSLTFPLKITLDNEIGGIPLKNISTNCPKPHSFLLFLFIIVFS